ncbi:MULTISPECIES: helix-turn-helix transcriptional regulator [Cronobacter]|uniref:helix-turn-helix transcriptional regulator n=1 Tax=Cronobacter TaxID=413496 RepID=UPI00057769AB|nr:MULTISPECIES: YafY family protein [Cronobacter]EKK3985118.1 YafY family transcriptional regulator [Cronobacter sakazakii]ELY2553061.1 YafY family transcriptional regulator [Cronobacter sakazakii]ELY6001195.1 YafY family transcriptional regulator [Cronobacter sakazakii]ELY6404150.1 YafY family transcriptional regulator [Cronobacter sakazakii]MBF4813985.1 YafY family transcriptional regulator [Cronobacter sakazakii]
MTRTERLLELLQILRAQRYPITASTLSERLGISVRSLYRDIKTLQHQGVRIEGEAGIGYIVKSDFHLPPLNLSHEEINAITLGLNWVSHNTDYDFKNTARSALAKIHAVIPDELKVLIESQSYLIGPSENNEIFFEDIRNAIKKRKRIKIKYCDKKDNYSSRVIWPIGLAYMESCWLLVAWCKMRNDFRHFRTDKIAEMVQLDSMYKESRTVLLKKWRIKEGMCEEKEY